MVWQVLLDVVLLLAVCLLAGGLFARIGQSPLVGYLLGGMLVGGPGSLNLVDNAKEIEAISELGVALLLFGLGLEFSWVRLKSLGGRALGGGAIQVVLTLIVAAAAAFLWLGFRKSVAIGAMVALSSTACVLRVLMDRGELDSPHGRNSLAILLVQDIAVIPLAMLLAVMTGDRGPVDTLLSLGWLLVKLAGLVAVLYVVLNKIAVRALGTLTLERNRELSTLLAVVTGLGSAWAAHEAGISPALGAFVAGMFLGASAFATQIRAEVGSLRVVLLTLFFGAAGMAADPVWIVAHAPLVAGVSVAIVVGKALLVWAILRAVGAPSTVALATGISLGQIGEFAFVLAAIGRDSGIVSEATGRLIVSCAIVTLFATPFLVPAAPRIAALLFRKGRGATAGLPERPAPDVVIIGFGPVGQAAARTLAGRSERALVIDLNQAAQRTADEMGLHADVGDATQLDVLEHAQVGKARVVVITLPSRSAALTALHHVRSLAPHAHVLVRARYERHAADFREAGAHAVASDEAEAGADVARRLEERLDA